MSPNKSKLELTWIGKEAQPRLEPRILIQEPDKSYGDRYSDNMLIHGDNLLALKALEHEYSGKIQCVYIDPPFNTGSARKEAAENVGKGDAFEYYDDGIEHSYWLSLISSRLRVIHKLLANSGTIFVHIDNREQAYLKVIMDEIFGRDNFVQMISVKRATPAGFKVVNPGPLTVTDYILLYAKSKASMFYNPLRVPVEYDENYDLFIVNPNENPRKWILRKLVDVLYRKHGFRNWQDAREHWGTQWKRVRNSFLGQMAIEQRENVVSVRDPHKPSDTIVATMRQSKANPNRVFVIERVENDPIYIYNGGALSFYSKKVHDIDGELTPTELLTDFWGDVNFSGIAAEGNVQFKNSKKPEMLLRRIINLGSRENDIILDSFLGSGTTAAVAHKMKRRWIGIEMGDHCKTHCFPRLKSVVEGTDQTGVSKPLKWKGGGGFKYYYLAPSLLKQDNLGNWVIDERYNANMMAAAMAKHEGFRYQPDEKCYWKQGRSTENDYIFTTTNFLTVQILDHIFSEMRDAESLLICCKSFTKACDGRHDNITIKKIPKMLLGRCEFGRDDYSLNIVTMPVDENEPEFTPKGPGVFPKTPRQKKVRDGQLDLFKGDGNE